MGSVVTDQRVRPVSLIGVDSFHVKRDGFVTPCIVRSPRYRHFASAVRFTLPALKRHPGKFLDVKKFRTAQMIVAFLMRVSMLPHVDLCSDRGILRTFPIDFDPAAETRELALIVPRN